MSREEFKARERVTQKMTRDGLVERNEATGGESRVSKREAVFDLRGDTPERDTYSQVGNRPGDMHDNRKRNAQSFRQPEQAHETETATAKQNQLRHDTPPMRTDSGAAISQTEPKNDVPPPQGYSADLPCSGTDPAAATVCAERATKTGAETTAAEKRKIRKQSTYRYSKKDAKQQGAPAADSTATNKSGQHTAKTDGRAAEKLDSGPKGKKKGKLQFDEGGSAPEKPKSRKLAKAEHQLEKTSGKLEKAQKNLPAKRKLRSGRVFNEQTGKANRRLYFEKEVKSQKEHLKGALPLRPVKAGLNAAIVYGHKKIFQVEGENVEIKAAHRGEMAVEGGIRTALRFHKTAPYRKVAKLQHKSMKRQVNLTYRKALEHNPKLKKNPLARMWQKRMIKKNYAKQARKAQKAAKGAKTVVHKAGAAALKGLKLILMNPKVKIILLLLAFLLLLTIAMCSSMGGLGIGGIGGVTSTTYLAEDEDIFGAQAAYAGMEAELQDYLDNYEALNPGYDEYVFNLDSIWHDPYVLISILSALHDGAWTLDDVQDTLKMLFDMQYILTETVTVEVRTRTVTGTATDPDTGETYGYEYEEQYDYYIMTVTLQNFNLSHIPIYIMGEQRLGRYALLMWTLGNRPDLFPASSFPHASYYREYGRHDIPQEYLDADPVFAAMMAEARKHLGMPYVWGGSSPVTSFDCSGFVSWVLNQSGWNIGRLGASGLYNICTPVKPANARPGDLVFFIGTYNAPNPNAPTHVGIYVGDGMMVHAGNPIGFVSINTTYWQNHFYSFGRP